MRDEAWEAAKEKADFCLKTGISPSEYDQMTVIEVAAFIEVHNKIQKESNRK